MENEKETKVTKTNDLETTESTPEVEQTEKDLKSTSEMEAITEESEEEKIQNKKAENQKKRSIDVTAIIVCLVLAIAIAYVLISNSSAKEEEFTIKAIKTQLDYTSDGEPADPLELVSVTRTTDESKDEDATEAYIEDGLTVTADPEIIDTSVLGEVEVTYTIVDTDNKDFTKEETLTFEVVNNEAPAFKTTGKETTITVGDEFDAKTLIKDDADLKLVEEEPTANEDGTYEYGWYTVTSNVKTDKAGTYSVKFHAVGTNGVSTDSEVKVKVEEKSDSKSSDSKSTSTDTKSSSSTKSSDSSKSSKSSSKKTTTSSSSTKSNTSSTKTSTSSSSSSNSTASSNSSSSSSNNSGTATKTCTETYHAEEGHWETVVTGQTWVVDTPSSTYQDGYTCNSCGQFFDNSESAYEHCEYYSDNGDGTHTFSSHYTTTQEQGHWDQQTQQKWVTDKAAYTSCD